MEILKIKKALQEKKDELSRIDGKIEQCEDQLEKLFKITGSSKDADARVLKMKNNLNKLQKELDSDIQTVREKYEDIL